MYRATSYWRVIYFYLIVFIFGACNGFPDAAGDAAPAEAEEADEDVRRDDGPERQVVSGAVAVVVADVVVVHHPVVHPEHPDVSWWNVELMNKSILVVSVWIVLGKLKKNCKDLVRLHVVDFFC